MSGKPFLLLAILGMLALPLISAVPPTWSAETASSTTDKSAPVEAQKPAVPEESKKEIPPEKFSITHHAVTINGKTLTYTATAGHRA